MAFMENVSQGYGASPAASDHTVTHIVTCHPNTVECTPP